MATTRIIPMHVNKGKTIAQCLKARTDYAKNPDKTDGGVLVSSYDYFLLGTLYIQGFSEPTNQKK